jgi:pimeloyl-ACP methyl ester carboxylesterase
MAASEPSIYDRMCWPDAQLERALARGTHRRELSAYLGAPEYELLRALARKAARAPRRSAYPKVYLLPGIMGTQLGYSRAAAEPADLLWLDPSDIVEGRISQLRWGAKPALKTLGAIPYSYLPLKLRLRAAGFQVELYEYDWRGDLCTLGRELAARLRADPAERLALIGHSMGGLLARAALLPLSRGGADARIVGVYGLGAPHGGSMAAVQALRACYPFVCRLAAIDTQRDAAAWSREVFHGFMSIYQLIPRNTGGLDLLDPRAWPQRGLKPDAAMLNAARDFEGQLAEADGRFVSIIGTGQRTVTGIARRGLQFRYEISSAGDGIVAADRATLALARNFYVRCEHSELPRSPLIAHALVDLLRTGRTRRLPQQVQLRRGRSSHASDAALQRGFARKIDWHALSSVERRRYLQQLNAPPPSYRSRPL